MIWAETSAWRDGACGPHRGQRRTHWCFSPHLSLSFLFSSSCVRSGRAMECFINTSPSTWWGESSALGVEFPRGRDEALQGCSCPWGDAALSATPEGIPENGKFTGRKWALCEFRMCWYIPHSMTACGGYISNLFCLLMVRPETLWRKWGVFLRGFTYRRSKDTNLCSRSTVGGKKDQWDKLVFRVPVSLDGLQASWERESSEKKKIPTGHQILLSPCLIQMWFIILATLYFKK